MPDPVELNLSPANTQTLYASYLGGRVVVTTKQAIILEARGRVLELIDLTDDHTLAARPDGAWELNSGPTVNWVITMGKGCGCGGTGRVSQEAADNALA